MTDSVPRKSSWLWIAVIAALAILALIWLVNPSGNVEEIAATPDTTAVTAPTEGYATAPAGDGVPVDLPQATMAPPPDTPEAGAPATPAANPAP